MRVDCSDCVLVHAATTRWWRWWWFVVVSVIYYLHGGGVRCKDKLCSLLGEQR
jgi:hypothetical protein